MAAWASVLHALWIFLPAYVANMSPVLVAKVIPGWKSPIDGGRMGKDGKRILGPGKTWRGLVGGTILGGVTAGLVAIGAFHWALMDGWDYGAHAYYPHLPLGDEPAPCVPGEGCADLKVLWTHPALIVLFGAFVGFMALVGDAVKSYFKRRIGKDRGRPWFPFDQLDFVVFGLLAMAIASPLLADGWVKAALLDDWIILATLIILTPLLHFLVNVLGYVLKLKDVPW